MPLELAIYLMLFRRSHLERCITRVDFLMDYVDLSWSLSMV